MLKRKLLLEGISGCGKSTAIVRSIGDDLKVLDGFLTARLYSNENNEKSFAFIKPYDFIALKLQLSEIKDTYNKDIFLEVAENGKAKRHIDVIERTVSGLLGIEIKKALLLDEIGGYELLKAEIFDAYLKILAMDIPVIGVIKHRDNMTDMAQRMGLKDLTALCVDFRKRIIRLNNVDIIDVSDYMYEEIEQLVKEWKDTYL